MATTADTPALPRAPRIALLALFVFTVVVPIAIGALDTGDVRCEREAGRVHCEYVKALLGLERERARVEDVTGARMDFKPVKKARGTYRTVLLTRAGEVPLPDAFNWNDDSDPPLAEQVSSFLRGNEPSLTFTQAGWGGTLVLCTTLFWLALRLLLPRLRARAAQTT